MKKINNIKIILLLSILFIYLVYNNEKIELFQNDMKQLVIANHLLDDNTKLMLEDNIIICGNGPDILDNNIDIDNYKTVVRVNCYKMLDEDYYSRSGKKCDLFVWCGNTKEKVAEIMDKYRDSNHLTYNNDIHDVFKKYSKNIYQEDSKSEYKCNWDANNCLKLVNIHHDKLKDYNNKKSYLSTGLKTIMWFISSGFKDITIKGFTTDKDSMYIKDDKIYRKDSSSNNKEVEVGCCHDLFEEVNILNKLINNNIIKYKY